jgi:phosphate starvation-inducible protein PhoH and related proteins
LSNKRATKASRRQQPQSNYQTAENTIHFHQSTKTAARRIDLVPKSLGQERLIIELTDLSKDIVVAVGPAGTGKTYLAMQAAIKALRNGETEKIILTRPAVGVDDEKHGFLPGDLNQKMEPWTRPLLDVLREYYHPKDVTRMLEDGTIEISPLAFMRGRTFKNAWVIADEMQNATPGQMKMLLTRIGVDSRIIVTGDVEQADRATSNNGLMDLGKRLQATGIKGLALCQMTAKDIQRHPIIERVLALYS